MWGGVGRRKKRIFDIFIVKKGFIVEVEYLDKRGVNLFILIGVGNARFGLVGGFGFWGTKIVFIVWMVLVIFVVFMFKWIISIVIFFVKFAVIVNRYISVIMREVRCVNRYIIIFVWKLLRFYLKFKVDIVLRKISRFFLF